MSTATTTIGRLKRSLLYASLFGMRDFFTKEFDLRETQIVITDEQRIALKRKLERALGDTTKAPKMFPVAFFKITSLGIDSERGGAAIRNIARRGITQMVNVEQATIKKGFWFPVNIPMELHYFHYDVEETLNFIETVIILAATKQMVFRMQLDGGVNWVCEIDAPDPSLNLPDAEKSNNQLPGYGEVVFNFTLKTRAGFDLDVAKLNDMGKITTYTLVPGDPGGGEQQEHVTYRDYRDHEATFGTDPENLK